MRRLPKEVLLIENILTKDRLKKHEEWHEQMKLRKGIFDKVKDSFDRAKTKIMEVIYEINDTLRDCINTGLNDVAPIDEQ